MRTIELEDYEITTIREELETRLSLVKSGDISGYDGTKADEVEYLETLIAKL